MDGNTRRWAALGLLCAANFMVILDSQIVLLALPSVERDLGFTGGGAQWVLSAYLLGFGGLLLLGGRMADLAGRRWTFLAGTGLFLAASLLCGSAWSGGVLIGARVAQGVSAALMAPSALSIVTAAFAEGPERNRAIAVWAGVGGFGATAALLAGGPLTGGPGWRSIFFLNVPVALVLLALGPSLLDESRSGTRRAYDPVGALTVTLAASAAVHGVVRIPEKGWASAWTAGSFAVAVAAGLAFVLAESRSAAPLIPLRTFRSRRLTGGNAVALAAAMTVFGTSLALSLYAQGVLGYSPLVFGFATAVLPVAAVAGSFTAQAALRRVTVRAVAPAGLAFMAAGCLALARVPAGGYASVLLPGLVLLGFGLGASGVAGSVAALAGATEGDAGLASGINTAAFQFGGAFGVAVASTAVLSWADVAEPAAGFRAAFAASAGIALAGAVVAVALLKTPARRRVPEPVKVTT
ncbi:MFS transporter [Actinomadura sp. K4S16]|uniref:MFS transporter n=1 Tax=Actinomadura sp. K4S16 TaxID=1316147 RepID=UPI0011ED4704|nr:MFS transporter [Actinomadura sp. K4S16]